MSTQKVAITLDRVILHEIDRLVAEGRYPSRSRAIQEALRRHLDRTRRQRLADEAAKLDRAEERGLAEESLVGEAWPAS